MRDSRTIRLLVVTHYYYPEVGAPQTRLRESVAGLRRRGFEVTVVAPMPSYPLGRVPAGYAWWRATRERVDGTPVIRLPTIALPGARVSRRIAGQVAFAWTSLASVALAGRFDAALVESPPLLLAFAARALHVAGVPYVFHVADPWPDFPIAMGYLQSRVVRRLAFAVEDLAYGGAAAITTVSPGLVELLSCKPSAAGRVQLLPNAVDLGRFDPAADSGTTRARLGWEDAFTVVYVGTVGLAQGVGTLLEAARLVDPAIRIHIVGEGVEKADLAAAGSRLDGAHVNFREAVPAPRVPAILAAADAGLVMLRRGAMYDASLPTKLLETMAAGRPVIVSADGFAASIVRDAGAGYIARAGDPADLARAIDACRIDRDRAARGRAGRAHVSAHYDREVILDRLAAIIAGAASGRRGSR